MAREYIAFRSETISQALFSIVVFKDLGIYSLTYITNVVWDSDSENLAKLTSQDSILLLWIHLASLSFSHIKRKCQTARFFLMCKFLKKHFKGKLPFLGYYSSIKDKIASLVAQEILSVPIFLPTNKLFAFKG